MKARKRNGKRKPSLKMAAQAIAKTVYNYVRKVKAAESKEMNETIYKLHETSDPASSSKTDDLGA